MKKKIVKKLEFNKEDISDLTREEQSYIIGGDTLNTPPNCQTGYTMNTANCTGNDCSFLGCPPPSNPYCTYIACPVTNIPTCQTICK